MALQGGEGLNVVQYHKFCVYQAEKYGDIIKTRFSPTLSSNSLRFCFLCDGSVV